MDGLALEGSKTQHVRSDKWWMDLPLVVTPYACEIRWFGLFLTITVFQIPPGAPVNND